MAAGRQEAHEDPPGPVGARVIEPPGDLARRGHPHGAGEVGRVRELRAHRARRPADLDGHVRSRRERRAPRDVDPGDLVVREPRAHLDAAEGGPRGARGVGHDEDDPVDARRREGMAHHLPVPHSAVAEAPPERQRAALGIDRPGRVEARQLAGRHGSRQPERGDRRLVGGGGRDGARGDRRPDGREQACQRAIPDGATPGSASPDRDCRAPRTIVALPGRTTPDRGAPPGSGQGVVRCRRTLVLFLATFR